MNSKKKKNKKKPLATRKIIYSIIVLMLGICSYFIFMKVSDKSNENNYDPNTKPAVGFVELKVSNLTRSVDFYKNLIGFEVLKVEDNTATLTAGGETPLLYLEEDKEAVVRPDGATGLFHFAILVPTRTDLALSVKRLVDFNYLIQGASDHQYSEAIYLSDPDGNGIEIYTDRKPNLWKKDGKGGYIGGTYPLDLSQLLSEIGSAYWKGLPKDTKVGHMHLQVSNIQESQKFYVDALGFDIVAKDAQMLFVSKDKYHHHIGMNTWAGTNLSKPPSSSLGLNFFSVHFSESEFESAKTELNNLGYEFEEDDNFLIVEDPSGNTLKIYNDK